MIFFRLNIIPNIIVLKDFGRGVLPVTPEEPVVPEQPEMPESTGPEASDEEENPLTSVPETGDMGILPHLLIMAGAASGLILLKKRTS